MELRKITPEDWQLYRDFRLAALQSPDARAFGGSYSIESLREEKEWRSLFDESKPRFFYGYFDENKIVSVAGVYLNEVKTKFHNAWIIVGVYTSPEYRGKGLSLQTMNAILDDLESRSVPKVVLMVNSKQEVAIKLYENLGFKRVGLIKDCLLGDGQVHDEIVMEKPL